MERYKDPSLSVEERVEDLLARMTPEEKAAQTDMMSGSDFATKRSVYRCSVEPDTEYDYSKLESIYGNAAVGFVHDNYSTPQAANTIQRYFMEHSRLGIPAIFTGEALHGINGPRGTIFPVPLALGATFDRDLIGEIGSAIGSETRSLGMQEILAPNLDVARDIRWGRTEETFGEDTYLSSRMAVSIIRGEMKNGEISRSDAVLAEPKHYCVHGIAEGGLNCASARVGVREVENCYLPVFEAAIREGGARNVMVSYNCIDGDLMMTSKHYLKTVLKERFGLKGYSRADWGGIQRIYNTMHMAKDDRDAIRMAICNGVDMKGLDYDYTFWNKTVAELIRSGEIPQERIDDIVRRVLTTKFELGLFEHPYTEENGWADIIRCEKHRELAYRAAQESVVLLKNDGILPIRAGQYKSIAVVGPSSHAQKLGGYSGIPVGYEVKSIYECLKDTLPGVTVRQADGCAITPGDGKHYIDGQPHLTDNGIENIEDDIDGTVALARECDLILFVGGDNPRTSGEGQDRSSLVLAGKQRELILRLAETGKPLVIVLECGKPVDLTEEEGKCNAIVNSFFAGEYGAQAVTDILTGKFNPTGKLNISWPKDVGRLPCYYSICSGGITRYYEGDRFARYPFGYGLSYTSFAYSDMQVKKKSRYGFEVTVKVKNTGDISGSDVVQMYVTDCESTVVTPDLLLKGFERVTLQPGEEKIVTFVTDESTFSLIDQEYKKVVEPGNFVITIARDSVSPVLTEKVFVD